jgi:hypothetical protein
MAKKKFTEEEMNNLKASHYVLDVSPSIVHFSVEFKEKFWVFIQIGKTPREAVIELGVDPNILGENRLAGLKILIGKEYRSGKGFRDITTTESFYSDYMNPETRVRHLEQQLAYKNQEIEFLKKIVSLGRAGVDS